MTETSTVGTDATVQVFAVVPTKQPVIRSILKTAMLQPMASSSTNKRRIEHEDDYATLIPCEIERLQFENRKLELECSVLELKRIPLRVRLTKYRSKMDVHGHFIISLYASKM